MLNQLTKLLFSSLSTPLDTQTTVYNFNKGTNISVTGNTTKAYNASILLKYYFASISCFISKPLFTISPSPGAGKVVIHLCYYNPSDSLSITTKVIAPDASLILADSDTVLSFQTISHMLNQIFNKPVELELIPLRYPYHDSTILAQVLAVNSNKYNFNRMMQKLFQKATIITKTYSSLSLGANTSSSDKHRSAPAPISQLTGIKVTIAGRLITQRIVPKSTVKTAYKGQLSSTLGGKMSHKFIDSATYTSKNKIGAYTVRVQLGHKVSSA